MVRFYKRNMKIAYGVTQVVLLISLVVDELVPRYMLWAMVYKLNVKYWSGL